MRFVLHFNMKPRDDLSEGEKKLETYMTFLARDRNVAPTTQNQVGFYPVIASQSSNSIPAYGMHSIAISFSVKWVSLKFLCLFGASSRSRALGDGRPRLLCVSPWGP